MTPDQIQETLRLHHLVDSGDLEARIADFSRSDLINADFSGLDLGGARFECSNLSNLCFQGTDLTGANLTCVGAASARFEHATLDEADLTAGEFRAARFRMASLRSIRAVEADFTYAIFIRADLTDALLTGCSLRYADLTDAVMEGTNLEGADLENAILPRGYAWWQGGCYGPRHRMIRVWATPSKVTVYAGCLSGSAEEVIEELIQERFSSWVEDVGHFAALDALRHARELIEMGLRQVAITRETT